MARYENSRIFPADESEDSYPIPVSGHQHRSSTISVDVLLVGMTETMLRICNDEDSPPRWVHRKGIQITNMRGECATLTMSEDKAIDLDLV